MPTPAQSLSYYDGRLLLIGLLTTLGLAVAGCGAGFLFGFAVAILRTTRSRAMAPLRAALFVYCLLLRRIPFLVTLLLVFFACQSTNAGLSTFAVALITVGLIATAYLSEIIRGGLESVHAGQWQAARALNFTHWQALRYVIVPQAWRVILPPAVGFLVMFIKDTALASQIGVMELTSAGKVLGNKGLPSMLVYGMILLLYFLISYPLTRLGRRAESKLAFARNR
jgi:polar amino acid transport system permease protein